MTEATQGPDGKFIRTLRGAERDAEAASLRAKGRSFQVIAEELGYANKGTAHKAVMRAFAAVASEAVEEAKQLDLQRIDMLIEAAWVVLETKHVHVSQGRIVGRVTGVMKDPDTGKTIYDDDGNPRLTYEDLEDDAPVLAAIDRIERLIARRERSIGYAAPARVKVQVITDEDLEDEAAGLRGDIAGLEAEAADGPDAGSGVA